MAGGALTRTKHFQISRQIGERIRFMAGGEYIPSVAELMKEFNASQATIVSALHRLRLQGVVERPMGKRRLIVARQGTTALARVALIRPLWSNPDIDSLLNVMYTMGHEAGLEFHAYLFADLISLNLVQAIEEEDDAVILAGVSSPPQDLIKAFNGSRRPLVFMGERPKGVRGGQVWASDHNAGIMATEHLLKLGHRRIAIMHSEPDNESCNDRMNGWREAMTRAGEKKLDRLVLNCSVERGHDAIQGSYRNLVAWLQTSKPEFTALFCSAWTGSLAAMRAFQEFGYDIPGNISLITCNNEDSFASFLTPALTTVSTDVKEHARHATDMVLGALSEGVWKPQTILIEPKLIERKTTAPYRR